LFQGISVVLVLVFLYFVGNYIDKYVERQDEKEKQIDIFTGTVFPSVTYIRKENNMGYAKNSNEETVSLTCAALMFLFWTFIASFMLGLEYRYIGISLSGVTLCIVALLILNRIKQAIYIEAEEFKYASIQFY
jgi:membrane protein implicated in regulation of membrane protease activity